MGWEAIVRNHRSGRASLNCWRKVLAILKLKYVNSYRDRLGKQRHYFRRAGVRVPLSGIPGSAVFMDEYRKLLAQHAPAADTRRGKAEEGTVAWVIAQYKKISQKWKAAKPKTREQYERRFLYLATNFGAADFSSFTESSVREIRNRLRATPAVADDVKKMIGRLWRFAKEHLSMELGPNPASEVAAIHTERKSHKAWPPELCAEIESHKDPKVVRAYYLLRYTGQRVSDVACMKGSQFDGTAVELFQIKTSTYVWMPAHEALQTHLKGHSGEYLLMNTLRKPYTAKSLSALVASACQEAGFDGYSSHGLRHLAGAALAEAGCSVHEIMSILGHLTEKQAMEYTRQANRKLLAGSAMTKWAGTVPEQK
jgi:integrase